MNMVRRLACTTVTSGEDSRVGVLPDNTYLKRVEASAELIRSMSIPFEQSSCGGGTNNKIGHSQR